MPARIKEHTACYYEAVNTTSVTTDLTNRTNGPQDGSGLADGDPARAIIVCDVTSGTTVEVTRPDGTQVVLTRYAIAGVEYPCQVKKVLPATNVDEYIAVW